VGTALFRFVTNHAFHRKTDKRTEFSSLYRVCIPCSAVKIKYMYDTLNLRVNSSCTALSVILCRNVCVLLMSTYARYAIWVCLIMRRWRRLLRFELSTHFGSSCSYVLCTSIFENFIASISNC